MLLFWICRVVLLTHLSRMHDDLFIFALTERVSLVCGLVIVGLWVSAAEVTIPSYNVNVVARR